MTESIQAPTPQQMRSRCYRGPRIVVLAWLANAVAWTGGAVAAQEVPVHPVVPLLDDDKPIFGQFVNYIGVGSDRESAVAQSRESGFDYVVYDLEHTPFDIPRLAEYMQWLLDRRAIAESGLTATKTVFVRMPMNLREGNEWLIKAVLDTGVHGLAFPHTETVEQVVHAVRAMRYPQVPGSADFEPDGIRGFSPAVAARYWGLDTREYQRRADIWRLDPNGSLVPIFIIENKVGVENVREIARTLRDLGVGAVLWAGSGDMRISYAGDVEGFQAGMEAVFAAGREFGFPVGVNGTDRVAELVPQGVRMYTAIGAGSEPPPEDVRRAVGR
jgi:4-hydroxy-2-oxoheptanedioate aldolase